MKRLASSVARRVAMATSLRVRPREHARAGDVLPGVEPLRERSLTMRLPFFKSRPDPDAPIRLPLEEVVPITFGVFFYADPVALPSEAQLCDRISVAQ